MEVKAVLGKGYADSLSMLICFDECLNTILFGVDELEVVIVPSYHDEREFLWVILGQLHWVQHHITWISTWLVKCIYDLHILHNKSLDHVLALAKFKYVWVIHELEQH